MNKSNKKAFIDAKDFDDDGISILPSTKEVDDTLEEAFITMPSNVFTLSRGLPLTAYTMGDTENIDGADKIETPSYETIQGRTTRTYVPASKNEPISPYMSPVFIETDNTPKITNYKELKNFIRDSKKHTENNHINITNNEPTPSHLGIETEIFNTISKHDVSIPLSITSTHTTWIDEVIETSKNKITLSKPFVPQEETNTNYHQLQNQRKDFDNFINEEENKILIEHIQNVIDSHVKTTSKEENHEDITPESSKDNKTSNTEIIVERLKYEFKTELDILIDRWTEMMAQQSKEIDKQTRKNFEELFLKFLNS